jgi:hypothetical protein
MMIDLMHLLLQTAVNEGTASSGPMVASGVPASQTFGKYSMLGTALCTGPSRSP